MVISGHRGAPSLAPENTMGSFELARGMGVDMVSIDVRRTRDGQLVVIHDPTVDRTTNGHGDVADLTWPQIRALDAGKGERVPSFDQVLDWAHGRVKLEVEIKQPARYPGIERQVLDAIRRHGAEKEVLVDSFDHAAMAGFKHMAPDIQVGCLVSARSVWKSTAAAALLGSTPGLVSCHPLAALGGATAAALLVGAAARRKLLAAATRQPVDVVLPNWSLISKRWVHHAHQRGKQVIPFTENNRWLVGHLGKCGVDGIITDTPQRYTHN